MSQWLEIQKCRSSQNSKVLLPMSSNFPSVGVDRHLSSDHFSTWTNPDKQTMTFYYSWIPGTRPDLESKENNQIIQNVFDQDFFKFKSIYPELYPSIGTQILFPQGAQQLEQYDSPVAYNWTIDPYSLGGYSYSTPEFNQATQIVKKVFGQSVIAMFHPVRGQIFFAGEHTDIEYPATMAGAVTSGKKAAQMFLESQKTQ